MDGVYHDIINVNEEIVAEKLESLWESSKYCTCDICKRDVFTYALNQIKPRYVDSVRGKLYMKLKFRDKGENIEIIKVVNEAVELIGQNPNHDNRHT